MVKEEQGNAPGTLVEAIMGGAIRVSDIAIGCLILAAIALNFSNVVARYVFASAISWAEEVLIFLSVWSVFLGAASSAWEDAHLRMDLVLAIVPNAWRKALTVFSWVVAVLVGGVVLFASWHVV